jgi:RNA polymerase sigma-70 factor (ECF subfamily)
LTKKEYIHITNAVSSKLYSYLKNCVGDADVAQDLVQDSYEKLWENRRQLKVEQAEKWLFTTGYRAMLHWIRKNKRVNRLDNETTEELVEREGHHDLKEWIDLGLKSLTIEQKQIILLRDMQGHSYQEIEEITGLKESQVKVYLFRARKKLKSILTHLDQA